MMRFPVPRRSNCLVWALRQLHREGGYLIVRKSRHGPWPHFLWSPDLRHAWGYGPIRPHRLPWDLCWFRGAVSEE